MDLNNPTPTRMTETWRYCLRQARFAAKKYLQGVLSEEEACDRAIDYGFGREEFDQMVKDEIETRKHD